MKRTLLAAILATAAIAFSCSVEEPAQSNSIVTTPTVTIADFVAGGAPTKTVATFNDNSVSFAFTASDVLRAYPVSPEQGDGIRFTVKSNKGTSCIFEGSGFGLMEGQKYAAYYPGGSDDVPEVTAVPVSFLGQSQPAASEWNLSDVDFLYAKGIEPANGACSFQMKHLGSMLIIDVTFEEAGVYKALTLTSDLEFIVKGTVDLSADEIELEYDETTDLAESMTLALGGDNGMAVEAGQTVSFYMMMAPDDAQAEAELTIAITDVNDNVTTLNQGNGFAFESGKAYKFGYTIEAPDPSNLSANGTANCYIVDVDNLVDGGEYHFDASVAGNGVGLVDEFAEMGYTGISQVYPVNGAAALLAGSTGVNVLLNQNNCIEDAYYENGKVFFKATGAKGNAKISIVLNNINHWTWLIWCTDKPKDITFTNSNTNVTYTALDRNIGALASNYANGVSLADLDGLYFQFGNPIAYTPGEFSTMVVGAGNNTQQACLWNPTRPVGWDRNWENYWFDRVDTNKDIYGILWGGGSSNLGVNFGPDYAIKTGHNTVKTMYDPCPPGYKVAPKDFLEGYNDTSNFDELSADPYGMYLEGTDGTLFFPYSGGAWAASDGYLAWAPGATYRRDSDDNPCYIFLWTASHNGLNMAYCFQANHNTETKINGGQIGTHTVARGLCVRCIAE